MSLVRVAPQVVADGVGNLARIGSSIGVANAAAAAATTTMVPAGGDEVSVAVVGLFRGLGQDYQLFGAQLEQFHQRFVQILDAAKTAYLETETAAAAAAVADGQYQVLVEPVQTLGQAWLASPAGELLDPLVNAPFASLTGRELVGNGAAGVAGVDGGAGQAGGWLFGDGGPGAAATATSAAGRGGDAGLIGAGGAGGAGWA
ncbi:PE family protein, partial [Mycobacterium marinum]|uniref:PE family protein n=15 Tax=Mycobacterium marinum TaxID=1781 RepID=UPI0021C4542F